MCNMMTVINIAVWYIGKFLRQYILKVPMTKKQKFCNYMRTWMLIKLIVVIVLNYAYIKSSWYMPIVSQ